MFARSANIRAQKVEEYLAAAGYIGSHYGHCVNVAEVVRFVVRLPRTHLLEVNGTERRVLVEDTVRRYSFHARGSEMGEVWQAGYFNDREREFQRTFDAHMEAMLAAFKAGAEPPIHTRAGRRALALAYAAIESFASGKRAASI